MTQPAPAQSAPAYGASLTLGEARTVAAAAQAEAVRGNLGVIIAVVDAGGHLVCLDRLDGAQFGSIRVAETKARSAVAFKRPTKIFEDSLAHSARILAIDEAMPVDGGYPLVAGGRIVGGIGVAGATPEQDGKVAMVGAAALS